MAFPLLKWQAVAVVALVLLGLCAPSAWLQASSASPPRFILIQVEGGLTNQMMSIAKGLVVARSLSRTFLLPTIRPQHDKQEAAPFSYFFNEKALLNEMARLGLDVQASDARHHKLTTALFPGGYVDLDDWLRMNQNLTQDAETLYLTAPFMIIVPTSFRTLESLVFRALQSSFADWLTSLVPDIRTSIAGCVHLRFEDDILQHQQSRPQCNASYIGALRAMIPGKQTLYVAFGDSNGRVQRELQRLRMLYRVVDKKDFLAGVMPPAGREAKAIVEQLLCQKADAFVGFNCSTFSIAVAENFIADSKPSRLVPCCEQRRS